MIVRRNSANREDASKCENDSLLGKKEVTFFVHPFIIVSILIIISILPESVPLGARALTFLQLSLVDLGEHHGGEGEE